MNTSRTSQNGFTLIEILVATMVFAFLMISAFQLFNSVTDFNDRSESSFKQQNQLNIAWSIIFQDILQMRSRTHRDIQGDRVSAYETSQDYIAQFTRAGLPPINGVTPGGMQLVAYELDEEQKQFNRLTWTALDLANDAEPNRQVLIDGVSEVLFEHLTTQKEWSENWPPINLSSSTEAVVTNALPAMIRITLTLDDERELVRLMPGVSQ